MKPFEINGLTCDEIDKKIILLTQEGLEITSRPYLSVANSLGISEAEVTARLKKMSDVGFIRKNAIATNHYMLGYVANAMTVWDIDDLKLADVGIAFKNLGFISHCYERPRLLPEWTFNLFAMVHGKSTEEVEQKVKLMKEAIGRQFNSMDLIYSTQILKKTGIRLKDKKNV